MNKLKLRIVIAAVIALVFAIQLSEMFFRGEISSRDSLKMIGIAVVASALVLTLLFGWSKIKNRVWYGLSFRQRVALVTVAITLFLGWTFISNHGQPDAEFDDTMACVSVAGLLIILGLQRLFSRAIDYVWARISRRLRD